MVRLGFVVRVADGLQNALHVRHDIRIGKPDHPKPFLLDQRRSPRVITFLRAVAIPVEFYCKAAVAGCEIDDVGTDENLLREFDAVEALGAEAMPEPSLRPGRLAAHRLGVS